MEQKFIDRVRALLSRVTLCCLEKSFTILVEYDRKQETADFMLMYPRVYIQLEYNAACNKGGENDYWKGRKWYLSEHMLDDEIIKTTYAAFQAVVVHEIMEGFKVDDKIVFNPHVSFEDLMTLSDKEVKRS